MVATLMQPSGHGCIRNATLAAMVASENETMQPWLQPYCVLSYEPKNEVAKNLYSSFGFIELNEPGYYEEGDEISAVLKL